MFVAIACLIIIIIIYHLIQFIALFLVRKRDVRSYNMVIQRKVRPALIVGAVPYPGTPQPSPMIRPGDSPYWPLTEHCGGRTIMGLRPRRFARLDPSQTSKARFSVLCTLVRVVTLPRQSSETQSKMIIRLPNA